MKPDFGFFKTMMPSSRKADYYLGCFDGAVYIDFNRVRGNRIVLCRISFDGYGCCNIPNSAECLDEHLSRVFIGEMRKDMVCQDALSQIVMESIRLNKEYLWSDALEAYGLSTQE